VKWSCVCDQDEGATPLHISVMDGDEAMVKLLHSFKANASVPDKVFGLPLLLSPSTVSLLDYITSR